MSGMDLLARIDPDKVAAYIRWSTEEQTQGTTPEVQKAACENYIRSQGWNFNEELLFVDDGYSGATLDRPALNALRRAVAQERVQCVVVYTLDRLSRSVADTVDLVLKEWEDRCHVRCVQQPIDTTHPTGKMFFYILASYAEFERDMIRMRTSGGKQRRAKEGANAGWRYNYGYTKAEKGVYRIHPEQAEIVRWLFREYVAGKGFKQLAMELNARKLPSPEGKLWSPNGVRSILSNSVYVGRIEYGKARRLRKDGKTIYVKHTSPQYAIVEDAVPALVNRELWELAQRRRKERAAASRRTLGKSQYLLSGIARCGNCGRPLAGVRARDVRYYRCIGRREFGRQFCNAAIIRADKLEQSIVDKLKGELKGEALVVALRTLAKQHEEEMQAALAEISLLSSQRNSTVEARRRLDRAFDKGDLDAKVYSRRDKELEEKLQLLSEQLAEAKERLSRSREAGSGGNALEERIEKVDAWEHLSLAERKALLRDALWKLEVYQEGSGKFLRNRNPVEVTLVVRI